MKILIEFVDKLAPIALIIWLLSILMSQPDNMLIAIAGIGGWLCYIVERRYATYLTIQLAKIITEIRKHNA